MTKKTMWGIEVEATIHNMREDGLVIIFEEELKSIVENWAENEMWANSFEEARERHWRITDVKGLLTAMYFMDMIPEPVSVYDVYKICRTLVEERRAA